MGKSAETSTGIGWNKFICSLSLTLSALIGLSACTKSESLSPALSSQDLSIENSAQIIGGQPVNAEDVAVQSTVGLYDLELGQLICTGSIVSSNIIVTAAHCLEQGADSLVVIFTTKVPQTNTQLNNAPYRHVLNYKINENYLPRSNAATDQSDIALIKIEGTIPTSHSPVPLLQSIQSLVKGMPVQLAGFGYVDGRRRIDTTVLRKVTVNLMSPQFGSSEIAFDQRALAKGACMGDSGGPALITQNGQTFLIGVTSRGVGRDSWFCRSVTVYTSIAAHLDWIAQTSTQLNAQ